MKQSYQKHHKQQRSYRRSNQRTNQSRKNIQYSRSRNRIQNKHSRRRRYSYSSYSSSSSSSDSDSYSSSSRSYSSSSSNSKSFNSQESISVINSGSTAKRRNAPHYHYKKGQKIGHKYKVIEVFGEGTFGRVLKCQYQGKFYAIKIIKPVQKYIKSAKIEKNIVKQINEKDRNDKYGFVRYIQSFEYRRHYCIVFQQLGKSLYNVIKKNEYKGFSKKLIKSFFYQILNSVGYLHSLGYTHTDLKPENILFEKDQFEKRKIMKGSEKYFYYPLSDKIRIIDFGSATKEDQHHSSIINTRQYRSPQVILECCRWNQISDVWSIGCIIVQLYTGDLLFDTHQNYQHLAMIQKNSGRFSKYMIEKCNNQLKQIFQKDGTIKYRKIRKYVGQGQNIIYMKTVKQIFQDDPILKDLLMKCLEIDPKHRISCNEALRHQYFKSY